LRDDTTVQGKIVPMRDPLEGLTADGLIRTGVARDRVPSWIEPTLAVSVKRLLSQSPSASVYVYGSAATGAARRSTSDLDLLAIVIGADDMREVARAVSVHAADVCRSVEIAVASRSSLDGDGDEPYGLRVFLHHYCVLVAGPDVRRASSGFPGDRRAARGFNGDIARHHAHWRDVAGDAHPAELGRRVSRKTLLAVAGLVSLRDATWTTDRETAAHRWAEVHPELSDGLAELLDWSSGRTLAERHALARHLDSTIDQIVVQFTDEIGLWRE
jgi:uncharacterized protein